MKKQVFILLVLIPALLLSGCAGLFPSPAAETASPAQAPEDLPTSQTAAAPEAEAPGASAQEPAGPPQLDPSEEGVLRISELMTKNRATLAEGNDFPDWIELQNVSDAPLDLSGWGLSDEEGEDPWPLPEQTLMPGACALILCGSAEGDAPFSLSAEETVCLYAPSGAVADRVVCPELRADESFAIGEDGLYSTTLWASPGYANSDVGYDTFAASRAAEGPLVINEVMVSNQSYAKQYELGFCDWVELKNVSDQTIDLSDYSLSDGSTVFSLAGATTLGAGKTLLVYCDKDEAERCLNTRFSFSPNSDRLYLLHEENIADYVYLHDIPVNGSCGRLNAEDGFFYFIEPTPDQNNHSTAYRQVSRKPTGSRDGVFNDVDSVTVELNASGVIYYTTDGTVPTVASPIYEGPFDISKTTIVRAVSVEGSAAPSRVLTLSYIVNENHEIPVMSIVPDDMGIFRSMYNTGYLNKRIPCSVSLYEDGESFTHAGGLGLAGAGTRTKYPKKSLSVKFSGKYGDGNLDYDLFDTGISKYDAITLHVGEDYAFTVLRTDLFQELALAMGGNAVAQHSKYCALYVNGRYYGLFCLKERWTKQFYASLMGVSEESVEVLKYPVELSSSFYREVIDFCRKNDLSDPANYQHFCELVNVDSLIDWFLLEGLAGNPDIGGNARVLRTTEGEDTRWRFGIYDLDWSMRDTDSVFTTFFNDNDYHYGQIYAILSAVWENPDFMDRLLTRYAELYNTVLSNENIVATIDRLADEFRAEMPRERELWGGSTNDVDNWERNLNALRNYILDNDLQTQGVTQLCRVLHVSDAVRASYFGW